jgi:hypothetical protein
VVQNSENILGYSGNEAGMDSENADNAGAIIGPYIKKSRPYMVGF